MRRAGLLWLVSLVLAVVALELGPSGQCTLATREAHEVAGDRRAVLFAAAAVLGF